MRARKGGGRGCVDCLAPHWVDAAVCVAAIRGWRQGGAEDVLRQLCGDWPGGAHLPHDYHHPQRPQHPHLHPQQVRTQTYCTIPPSTLPYAGAWGALLWDTSNWHYEAPCDTMHQLYISQYTVTLTPAKCQQGWPSCTGLMCPLGFTIVPERRMCKCWNRSEAF